MKGKHKIIIESERLRYEFEIKRNITVIQGDSATGKTTLVDLVQTYGRYGTESGIMMNSDVPCIAFTGDSTTWKTLLKSYENSIIFFDEDYSFIFTEDFAEAIRVSSNYYVLITRQPLYNLPYSINEIYGIKTTGRYHFPEKIYHEFYPLFPEQNIICPRDVVIMVEDEKAGFQFYHTVNENGNVECISARGNANVAIQLESIKTDKDTIVIADGAAFGAYISKVMAVVKDKKNIGLYLPESFEWIVLRSGVINIKNLDDIMEHPEEYIDSGLYFSWERFYTELLESSTKDDKIRRYDKSKLSDFYLEGRNRRSILEVLPEELREIFGD